MSGVLYGVGLGPGDPELVTLKAARIVRTAPVVAWFAKKGGRGTARTIADGLIEPASEQVPLYYPMTTETHFGEKTYVDALAAFYADSAALRRHNLAIIQALVATRESRGELWEELNRILVEMDHGIVERFETLLQTIRDSEDGDTG